MIVGSGTPEQARAFREQEDVQGTLVTDPTLEAYRLAGMKRGVMRVFNPKSAVSMFRALGRGHLQGITAGDTWQQGGVLVVAGGRLRLQHAASEAGQPTDFSRVVDALADQA